MIRHKRKPLQTINTEQSNLTTTKQIKSVKSTKLYSRPQQTETKTFQSLIHHAHLVSIFKQAVDRFKGTNQPILFDQKYNFSEKWQEKNKVLHEKNYNLLLSANSLCYFIVLLLMLHKIPLIWVLSTSTIFGFENNETWCIIGIIFIITDLTLKIYLLYSQIKISIDKINIINQIYKFNIIHKVIGDLLTIFTFMFEISQNYNVTIDTILITIVLVFQISRFLQLYNSITIILISYKYKNYVNLWGFISKIIIFLHIFAIMVYSLTYFDQQNNWLQAISKDNQSPSVKYVYSLYFTAATMLTVGYGDILPKNILEMLVIILIQLVGIILIGYIVSQIGHTLSTIRQNRQNFEQDIQNTDKICEYYQLGEDLRHRVRNYVINNQLANQQLNIDEEKHFLMKLNQDLRNQVKHENQLKIIKTSLFFICNWSKKMQSQLSKKLIKCIFSPNERIVNKDRLYIITKGKIDIFTEKKAGNKICCTKHLKTIEKSPNQQVYQNVYGYASMYTSKPSRLSAVSKDFSICYAIDFTDILDTIKDDERDFQYYHQCKCKVEFQQFPERFQSPNLINNRQHYCPIKWYVLKKYHKGNQQKNDRKQLIRRERRKKLIAFDSRLQEQNHLNDSQNSIAFSDYDADQLLPQKAVQQTELIKNEVKKSIISFRSYRRKHYYKAIIEDEFRQKQLKHLIEQDITKTSLFQVSKTFLRYFPKANQDIIIRKINKHTLKDFDPINSKNINLKWLDYSIFTKKINYKDIFQHGTAKGIFQ